MFTQFLEDSFPMLLGAAIGGLTIWWLVPSRRHLGAAILEALGIAIGFGLRPVALRAFPDVTDYRTKILIGSVVAGLVIAPLFYIASRLRRRVA